MEAARVIAVPLLLGSGLCSLLPAQAIEVNPEKVAEWIDLGPAPISGAEYSGRISAIVCSPSDPNLYYATGADGGVWRTKDGGQNWIPLTDHMPTTAMGALAMDPNDESVLYAGTGEANYANHSRYGLGIFKSADGGDSWQHLAESTFGGRTFSRLIVSHANSQRVYAAVGRAGGFPELAAAKEHPSASGPVGIFRSEDGGATWLHLISGIPGNLAATDLAMDPNDADVLYAAIGRIFGSTANGIYKSIDGGDSWTKLGGGLPTGSLGRISLAIAPSDSNRVYTLITNPSDSAGGGASTRGAWRSNNAGSSWTSLNIGSMQATYGWYLSVVSVQPTNANTVIMGGFSLQRSTTSGSSWSSITPPHVDMHAVAWDANGRLVVGDDGGVHRSTNLGGSWTSLNDGLGTIQFYAGLSTHPTDADIVYGGTQDNGTNRRNSGGNSWSQVFGGDGGWTQVDRSNGNRVFAEFQGTANLYRSTNGGSSFSYSGSGISAWDRNAFLPPYLIDPTNSNRMFYGTQRVYRSLDGGNNWSALSGDLDNGAGAIRALALAPSNTNVLYAATNDGNLAVSINGGFNFTTIESSRPGWPRVTREIYVDPSDAGVAYLATAAFGTDQVRRTQDFGQAWEVLDGNLPELPVNVVVAEAGVPSAAIFAGTDAGLYWSKNDGVTWSKYGAGLPNTPVIDIHLEPQRNRIVVGTQGRGAWAIEYP